MFLTRSSRNILSHSILTYEAVNRSLRTGFRTSAGVAAIRPGHPLATTGNYRLLLRPASTCTSTASAPSYWKNMTSTNIVASTENGNANPIRETKCLTLEDVQELRVPLPWGQLAVKQWGRSDGIPVLALHGWQDNAGTFDSLAPLLPSNLRLLCLDFAGHGLSSHYPAGMMYHYWDHVVHVKMVLDYLGLEKVSILGHSLGGTIALVFASLFPDAVERVATIDIVKPISLSAEAQPARSAQSVLVYQRIVEKMNGEVPSYTFEEARERLVKGNGGSIDADAAEVLMRRGVRKNDKGMFSYARDIRHVIPSIAAYTTEQHREYMSRVRCPLLVLKAKEGPYYEAKELYDEFVQMYRKNIEEFEYVEVEGTHHVHLVNPRAVAPHVSKFLCGASKN